MNLLKSLLKSKRIWVLILTAGAHLLAKYQVIVTDQSINAIADDILVGLGTLALVGSKVLDHKAAVIKP